MAFTGTAAVVSLGTRQARITDISLAAGASGTITAAGGVGDVTLPATFPALNEDLCKLQLYQVAIAGTTMPIVVAKDSPLTTFTITNADAVNATSNLEIYVEMVHSINA